MKSLKTILCVILLAAGYAGHGQVVADIKPAAEGKMGEFTEWQKAEASFDDGTKATFEYRIGLATRKGIACHYDLEVKNTSEITLNIKMKSSYYDKLVKGQFGDEAKEKLKPGKSVVARLIAQGCKKDKGSDKDDYGVCVACDFSASIDVSK
jgi:hypothetical protein